MKKVLKILGLSTGGLVLVYYFAFGALYVAGYRVYRVPGNDMHPTIQSDELVIGRLSESYRGRVKRFDLVVFTSPRLPGEVLTKRVVGLSGEHISVDAKGIMVEGNILSMPSAASSSGLSVKPSSLTIPDNALFVLGDNTGNSFDSRFFGPIPKTDVIGYLVFKK